MSLIHVAHASDDVKPEKVKAYVSNDTLHVDNIKESLVDTKSKVMLLSPSGWVVKTIPIKDVSLIANVEGYTRGVYTVIVSDGSDSVYVKVFIGG